ncbi:MAG TPA: hypothetical protein PKG49_11390 [Nitrosomonas mobilis]|nr:hypothetical protein [Nitrosomonas mobilis]
MSKKKSIISVAIGSAFAATLSIASIASAAENPFSVQIMDKGYMVAYGHTKADESKSGEGKCGAHIVDANKDGKVTKEEWDKHHDAMFEKMDANKDGVVDKEEMGKMKSEKRKMHDGGK